MKLLYFALFISVLFFVRCGNSNSETEIKQYIGKHGYAAAFLDDFSVKEKKAGGRDISITYDSFLNTYTVSYNGENGQVEEYKYKVAGFDSVMSREYFKQYPGYYYYIINEISKSGKISFIKKRKLSDKDYSYSGGIVEDVVEKE